MGLSHFCVAAGIVALLPYAGTSTDNGGWIGIFVLVLLVLLGFEFLFERLPLRNPEKWALALTPIARVLDWILSPVSATLVRFRVQTPFLRANWVRSVRMN